MIETALDYLLHGAIPVAGGTLSVREVVGNGFGLASALLGMRRLMWAWPAGLIGNVILFTVFVSGEIGGVGTEPLWGQAGRQVMFIVVGVYGWQRWRSARAGDDGGAVAPRWTTGPERSLLLAAGVVGYGLAYALLIGIGSYSPPTEAWILAGSLIATWGMARGWVEFWLVWIAVDVVGVSTLINAGYYPTAAMYLFYGVFCLFGFVTWWRLSQVVHPVPEHEEAVL